MCRPLKSSNRGKEAEWLLEKADAISGFVAKQRSRTQAAATKTAWGVAAKQLSTESELLSKQLQQLLQQAAARTPELAADVRELQEQLEQAAAVQQLERLQLLAQVQDLSGLVHSIRCYGLPAAEQQLPAATLASLQQELRWLAQDIQAQLSGLAAEAEQLAQEVAADAKLALAGDAGPDAATGSCSSAAGNTATGSTAGQPLQHKADRNGTSTLGCELQHGSSGSGDDADCDSNGSCHTSTPVLCAATDSVTAHMHDTAVSAAAEPIAVQQSIPAAAAGESEVQQLLAKHPLAPERLKQQVQEAFQSMVQQHQQQVQLAAATTGQQPAAGLAAKYGGWSADDHALFVRLRGLAFKSAAGRQGQRARGGRGCSRSAVLDRLSLMMPGKDQKELREHEAWYTAACLQQRRTVDLSVAWQRQLTAFITDSGKLLEEAGTAAAASAETAAARLAWKAAGSMLAEQLADLQLVKQQRQQELAARKEAKAKAIAAKVATAQAAWQQEHAAKKAQVAQYQQQVAQQMAEAQEAAAIAAAEAAAAAQAALAAQQPAVAARQAERRDRLQQQLEQQRQRQAAMAERQARLDAIAKALAPNVPNDPQRLLQPTAASTATADPAGAAFKPVHGYTTAQVVADQRFRVVEALHAAVLLNTAAKGYVQQVVASVQPTAATRVDNLNTVQLQATTRHGR